MNTSDLISQPACRADDAERCLLGQCMTWPRPCLDVASKYVGPEDFFDPAHQRLFARAQALDDETGGRFDLPMFEAALKREGALESIGGREALVALANEATGEATAEFHAKAVRRASIGRQLQGVAHDMLRATGAPDFRVDPLVADLSARLHALKDGHGKAGRQLVTRCAAEIEPESVTWLWPGRLPAGKLTILLGNPGQGKSLLSLAIAAAVTRGAGWPDARDLRAEPGSVLLASDEDDSADTIRPRAEAAGVDLARLHIIEGVGDERTRHVLDLGAHLQLLREKIEATPDMRLLILDPLVAFMPGPDSHKACEVRQALTPLKGLAQETGAAILAIHHMRKSPGQAIHRGLGSIAFAAAARSILGIGPDPANPTGPRRLLVGVKCNLAAPAPTLAFSLRPDLGGVPAVAWEAGPVEGLDADAVLGGFTDGTPGPDADAQNEAVAFLRAELADGPRPQGEIMRAARECGHSEKTLRRAKNALGVVASRIGFGAAGEWRWALPEGA